MIVYTNAFALSETALNKARIGWQTYTRNTGVVVTVSTESAEGPKDAPLRFNTYEAWAPTAVPATWKIDFGLSQQVDYAAVGGHNAGSKGSTLLMETSTDDSSYSALASSVAPGDDAAVMFLDTQRAARYLRLTVSNALCRIGVIYVGLVLKMQKSVSSPYVPVTMARDTVLHRAFSRGGQLLGQGFKRHGLEPSATFRDLTSAFVRSQMDPFVKSARGFPFFFAWNPLEFPVEVGYVWSTEDIRPSYNGRVDNMDVELPMRGVGNV